MYLIDVKKLYFYGVSFVSLLALCFSLMGGLSNLARYYWFDTGPLVTYQPPFISNWVPWSSLTMTNYGNPMEPITQKMEIESTQVEQVFTSFEDVDPGLKSSLQAWADSYSAWKGEQLNTQKAILDNTITNLSAFAVFLPVFLFHLFMALKLDKNSEFDYDLDEDYGHHSHGEGSHECACGGECDEDCDCDGECDENCACSVEDHHKH
jgi:hypothetical protein